MPQTFQISSCFEILLQLSQGNLFPSFSIFSHDLLLSHHLNLYLDRFPRRPSIRGQFARKLFLQGTCKGPQECAHTMICLQKLLDYNDCVLLLSFFPLSHFSLWISFETSCLNFLLHKMRIITVSNSQCACKDYACSYMKSAQNSQRLVCNKCSLFYCCHRPEKSTQQQTSCWAQVQARPPQTVSNLLILKSPRPLI